MQGLHDSIRRNTSWGWGCGVAAGKQASAQGGRRGLSPSSLAEVESGNLSRQSEVQPVATPAFTLSRSVPTCGIFREEGPCRWAPTCLTLRHAHAKKEHSDILFWKRVPLDGIQGQDRRERADLLLVKVFGGAVVARHAKGSVYLCSPYRAIVWRWQPLTILACSQGIM